MSEDFDPTDIDARQVAEAEAEDAKRLEREQDAEDFKWLMSDKRGRRFVWRLLSMTRLFHTPYTGKDSDTNFRCGEQNIGQQVLAEIHELCPERYHEMVKEQHDARRKRERKLEREQQR